MTRSELIEALEDYSQWLEDHWYLDCDWRSEEPDAISEYLIEREYRKENLEGEK